jgi:hypothetical protein
MKFDSDLVDCIGSFVILILCYFMLYSSPLQQEVKAIIPLLCFLAGYILRRALVRRAND